MYIFNVFNIYFGKGNDKIFDEFNGGIFIPCKAGDLCIWDSRTIHCNSPSQEIEYDPKTNQPWKYSLPFNHDKYQWKLQRMTCYVCMTPRYKASNEVLKKRQETAFKMNVTSTHWPHYFKHRIGGSSAVEQRTGFKLNEKQKRMVGYPRNALGEFIWKCKYEYDIKFSQIAFGFMVAAVISFSWHCSAKQKRHGSLQNNTQNT